MPGKTHFCSTVMKYFEASTVLLLLTCSLNVNEILIRKWEKYFRGVLDYRKNSLESSHAHWAYKKTPRF